MGVSEQSKTRSLSQRVLRKLGRIWLSHKQEIWRKKLKNKDFSIICSTCIGGVIYHDLGMQFLSPTINMFMSNSDFIKFACNLKQYLSIELNFIETDETFPVAMLGDIRLCFNHHSTPEEAAYDWNRRKRRVNYDNLFFIFCYREGYSIDEIRD